MRLDDRVWDQISVGEAHACGRSEGAFYCWGRNADGQLGIGNTSGRDRHARVQGLPERSADRIIACEDGTCPLHESTLWCWGSNAEGELGVGDRDGRDLPVQVGSAMDWEVFGDEMHCGIRNGGALFCWGNRAPTAWASVTPTATAARPDLAATATGRA